MPTEQSTFPFLNVRLWRAPINLEQITQSQQILPVWDKYTTTLRWTPALGCTLTDNQFILSFQVKANFLQTMTFSNTFPTRVFDLVFLGTNVKLAAS